MKSCGKQTPVRRLTSSPPRPGGVPRARRENVRLPPAPRSPDPRGRSLSQSCLALAPRADPATRNGTPATRHPPEYSPPWCRGAGAGRAGQPRPRSNLKTPRCQRGGTREEEGGWHPEDLRTTSLATSRSTVLRRRYLLYDINFLRISETSGLLRLKRASQPQTSEAHQMWQGMSMGTCRVGVMSESYAPHTAHKTHAQTRS